MLEDGPWDARATVTSPEGRSVDLAVEAKKNLTPLAARELVRRYQTSNQSGAGLLVTAPFIGPVAREILVEARVGLVDVTGNIRVEISSPGLFIECHGADRDPKPGEISLRTLRGESAARVVRTLIECSDPGTVRDIARRARTDPGHVSRILQFMAEQDLIRRSKRGSLLDVRWPSLLKRWATDAPLEARAEARSYLAPRGLAGVQRKLVDVRLRYAVTGSLAASRKLAIAPARLAMIYVEAPADVSKALDLREAETGANVLLLVPKDELVFERREEDDGVYYAHVVQVAADLLTGPGRSPSEGEELISWMQDHEGVWRE